MKNDQRFLPQPVTISGAAFLLILIAGAVLGVPGGAARERSRETTWTADFQSHYEQHHPLRAWAVARWGWVRYALFHEGSPGVVVGDDGWFFTAEEFAASREDIAAVDAAVERIAEVAASFSRERITLVVVIVPAKARVYGQYLGGHRYPEPLERLYPTVLGKLRQLSGVVVPDTLAALSAADDAAAGEALYLRTDTHWTPRGAEAVAAATAAAISASGGGRGIPGTAFSTSLEGIAEHKGDLLAFFPLGALRRSFPELQAEKVETFRTVMSSPGGGLFDEPEIPVALVGTSYSADDRWNFAGFLKEKLSLDLLVVAEEGLGPFAPMEHYLTGDTIQDQPPRIVIWELPERYLLQPLP